MSSFAARMLEAKRVKQDARNRGLAVGDFRGTVAARKPDTYADDLEADIAAIVGTIAWHGQQFAAELHWIVLEINDPTILTTGIPF